MQSDSFKNFCEVLDYYHYYYYCYCYYYYYHCYYYYMLSDNCFYAWFDAYSHRPVNSLVIGFFRTGLSRLFIIVFLAKSIICRHIVPGNGEILSVLLRLVGCLMLKIIVIIVNDVTDDGDNDTLR